MDLSSIEQIIRTRVPNAPSDNVELYLDSVDRVLSRGGDYSDMSEDDVVEDFEYYIQSRMDEVKKPTTKMKKSELKEMIKAAFLSEADFTSGQDDDAAPAVASMYDPLYEAEEESLDDILARIAGTKVDPYMAEDLSEAEEKEEIDIDVDAEEKTEKPANDSIVVDKRIVSLSSLPSDTRKILDSLETLRAQAEEFGDQKFITQVGNTITFFTRDFVVAGDEPTKAKVDESLEMLRMKKIAGLLTEGEYAKALLREEEASIADFLNANIEEFKKKVANPRSKFEIMGDEKVATAGPDSESGIDVSFDKTHMLELFPASDPFNKVKETEIAGRKVYYNNYL